ncbi:trehalose-phosphatase [Polaromonas sp. CT11-55]|uniref:trehalose-phosphatase n=1 Tax=Polaromonas sp. CT11-55 TaxID=3243045 RepID=UPI0039A761A2
MQLSPSPSPAPPSSRPALPGQLPAIGARTALFLDFDGTLADLAPEPDAVQLVSGVIPALLRLSGQLGGALAIVSGRRLADLDGFLAPLQLPLASEHGAQRRDAQGRVLSLAEPDLGELARSVAEFAAQHDGLRVEIKQAAVALHYRHAPELESMCLRLMREAADRAPGVELLHGKYVFEVKPANVSKGSAIKAFMGEAPFTGRLPLFAGDDTTDEAGFAAVQSLGGEGIKVGEGASVAHHRCASPDALREWLHAAFGGRSLETDGAPAAAPGGRP